jgi:hypothetical protein
MHNGRGGGGGGGGRLDGNGANMVHGVRGGGWSERQKTLGLTSVWRI